MASDTEGTEPRTPAGESRPVRTGGVEAPVASAEESSTGLAANVAGLLSYALGIVTGIIFLVVEKKSSFVRFHAMQSVVTFGSLLLVSVFGSFIPFVGWILVAIASPLSFVLWLLLMYKAFQGERFKLPLAGDIAEEHSGTPS